MRKASPLDACNCFATRRAARHISRLYERHFADAQVTSAQFAILVLLEKREMSMAGLADALVMDRTTLLRAIKPLQRERLLSSKPSTVDTRQLLFTLSPAGRGKLKEATRRWRSAQRDFESQVGAARAARMRRDLLSLGRTSGRRT